MNVGLLANESRPPLTPPPPPIRGPTAHSLLRSRLSMVAGPFQDCFTVALSNNLVTINPGHPLCPPIVCVLNSYKLPSAWSGPISHKSYLNIFSWLNSRSSCDTPSYYYFFLLRRYCYETRAVQSGNHGKPTSQESTRRQASDRGRGGARGGRLAVARCPTHSSRDMSNWRSL